MNRFIACADKPSHEWKYFRRGLKGFSLYQTQWVGQKVSQYDYPSADKTVMTPIEPATAPLAKRVVHGSIWVSLASYWNLAFGFAINIILTRMFTADVFGLYAYALFFSSLLSIEPKLGLSYAYAQSQDSKDESLSTYIAMEFFASVGGFAITLIAMPLLPPSVSLFTMVLSATAILQSMGSVCIVLLEKDLRFAQTSLLGVITNTLSYIPAIILATQGAGVWSLIAQNLVAGTMAFIFGAILIRRQLSRILRADIKFDKLIARTLLRFGVIVGLSLFAGSLLTQLDNFMVATFTSITLLGFYDRGYRLAQWPALLFNGLTGRIGLYTYSKLRNDLPRLQKMTTFMLWTISSIAFPLALMLFITAPDLLTFLYTDYWLPAAPFLRILALVSAVRPMWENAGTLLIAIGKPKLTTRFTIIQVFVLVATGVPLTLAFGAIGTCVAVGLAVLVGITLVYRYLTQEITLRLWSIMGIPLIISVLILLGYIAINQFTPVNTLPVFLRLISKALYTVIAFYGLIYLLQPAPTLERVRYIWQMATGKQI